MHRKCTWLKRYWDISTIDGITDSFNASPLCWTILVDDKVAGMFGCTDDGVAWLTTAPEINNKTAIRFIRQSKEYIKQMVEHCGGLMSYAHRDNYRLINWLEWTGFEMCGTRGVFKIWRERKLYIIIKNFFIFKEEFCMIKKFLALLPLCALCLSGAAGAWA